MGKHNGIASHLDYHGAFTRTGHVMKRISVFLYLQGTHVTMRILFLVYMVAHLQRGALDSIG
jgi:hypothetical protein